MRSCTGWPSGVWIDPPARKAPDGSNFQLQHWSHTFDFALVCGDGDWRAVEMPSRSAEFNHPLLAVVADVGGGELPADGSLLRVEPARTVQLGALKVAGNPTATGSSAEVDPASITLRLVETTGAPTDITLSSPVGELSELVAADLLEAPRPTIGPALRLHGYQIATVAARLDAPAVIEAVKAGKIRHFFLVGGCDGAKSGRNYYTEFAEKAPKDTVILTLACGKYRFNKLEFGDIGGIPRLLDVGQCNDAYSAIQIAIALAGAFECGVNDLPLSMILSWYEQKAVVILLTLLSLGIKNIRLGPTLPAFVTPNVLAFLVENFNIMPITTAEEDLKAILG
jgi:hypothetical protein